MEYTKQELLTNSYAKKEYQGIWQNFGRAFEDVLDSFYSYNDEIGTVEFGCNFIDGSSLSWAYGAWQLKLGGQDSRAISSILEREETLLKQFEDTKTDLLGILKFLAPIMNITQELEYHAVGYDDVQTTKYKIWMDADIFYLNCRGEELMSFEIKAEDIQIKLNNYFSLFEVFKNWFDTESYDLYATYGSNIPLESQDILEYTIHGLIYSFDKYKSEPKDLNTFEVCGLEQAYNFEDIQKEFKKSWMQKHFELEFVDL